MEKKITSNVSDVYDTVTTAWAGFMHYINYLSKDVGMNCTSIEQEKEENEMYWILLYCQMCWILLNFLWKLLFLSSKTPVLGIMKIYLCSTAVIALPILTLPNHDPSGLALHLLSAKPFIVSSWVFPCTNWQIYGKCVQVIPEPPSLTVENASTIEEHKMHRGFCSGDYQIWTSFIPPK